MKKSRKERKFLADKKRGVYTRIISSFFQEKVTTTKSFGKSQLLTSSFINHLIKLHFEEAHLIRGAARSIRTLGYH